MDESLQVRRFWFGNAPLTRATLGERLALWFGAGVSPPARRAADELIRTRFGALMARAATGSLAPWADSPRRRLSLILLLDQFPRNAFRGTDRAFATDRDALSLTLSGMQLAADAALTPVERIFFYMPLQHAEIADAQEEAVAAYRRLLPEAPLELAELFASALGSAQRQREIVARFGRFPHRNDVLGRESTPEELEYLGAGAQRLDR
jgi:uncharacterized protein (DUF924 family)